MSYEIILSKSVEKEIESLPKVVIKRVDNSILSLVENPRPVGSIKLTSYSNLYRIKKGNYRIVYSIDDSIKVIEIRQVEHRKSVYRKQKR